MKIIPWKTAAAGVAAVFMLTTVVRAVNSSTGVILPLARTRRQSVRPSSLGSMMSRIA